MKFLCNAYDPKCRDAQYVVIPSINIDGTMQSQAEAWVNYKQWLADKVLGDPVPTKDSGLTVAKLRAMGLVGVYAQEEAQVHT